MKKIKFSICLFIIIIGILLFTKLPVFAATGKATTSSLRIRKSASTESEVLEVLAVGDKVEILGEEGDWYKISAKGYTGYVSKSYINVDGNTANNNIQNIEPSETTNNNNQDSGNSNENNTIDNEQNNSEQTQENSSENNNTQQGDNQPNQNVVPENNATNKVYKIAENTQVYILPVLTSETIGDIAKDTNVSLINNAGLWGYVKTDSVKGWVRIDKLSSEEVPAQTQNDSSNEQNNENNNAQNANEQNDNSNNSVQSNSNENNNSTANNAQENQQNNNSEANNTQNNSTTVAYQPKTMYIKSTAVNVRSQSNTNSDIITGVGLNTQVKVVGEENGWYKVEVNGKSGYIRKDLLSDKKTETSSRSENIERTKQNEKTQAENNQTTTKVTTTTTPNESTTTTVTTATTPNESTTTTVTTATTPNESNSSTVQTATTPLPPTKTTSSGVTGDDIVAYAKQFVGYRYVYGAAGPNSFDCSGFTMYVYKHFGYSLSHSSKVQATQGVAVTGDLQAGDILVFKNGSSIGHVGIYIGNDKFIHASDSTTGVIISNLSDKWNISKYVGARRILK